MEPELKKILEKFDFDGDGTLDNEELNELKHEVSGSTSEHGIYHGSLTTNVLRIRIPFVYRSSSGRVVSDMRVIRLDLHGCSGDSPEVFWQSAFLSITLSYHLGSVGTLHLHLISVRLCGQWCRLVWLQVLMRWLLATVLLM